MPQHVPLTISLSNTDSETRAFIYDLVQPYLCMPNATLYKLILPYLCDGISRKEYLKTRDRILTAILTELNKMPPCKNKNKAKLAVMLNCSRQDITMFEKHGYQSYMSLKEQKKKTRDDDDTNIDICALIKHVNLRCVPPRANDPFQLNNIRTVPKMIKKYEHVQTMFDETFEEDLCCAGPLHELFNFV